MGSGDLGRTVQVQTKDPDILAVGAKGHVLEIEEKVDDILSHAGYRREFVKNSLDAHGCDGRSANGRIEHAPKGVAERNTVSALQGLHDDLSETGGALLHPNLRLQQFLQ